MQTYKSKSGKASGISKYQICEEKIILQFSHGPIYTYSYASAGKKAVEAMKKLALANKGLSTYISRHQPAYEN